MNGIKLHECQDSAARSRVEGGRKWGTAEVPMKGEPEESPMFLVYGDVKVERLEVDHWPPATTFTEDEERVDKDPVPPLTSELVEHILANKVFGWPPSYCSLHGTGPHRGGALM